MKLRAPSLKPIKLKPVRPNEGVRMAYQRDLLRLVGAMQKDLRAKILPAYKKLPVIAMDDFQSASIEELNAMIEESVKEWNGNFEKAAKEIAKKFTDGSMKATDVAFKSGLKSAGFSVKFEQSPLVDKAIQASLDENIKLIKSIAEEHLASVAELVRESAENGRDMEGMAEDLEERYGITERRAQLIVRDQNNKATAFIHKARQKQFGITKALWVHNMASITPRQEHMDWDNEEYDVEEGMYSEDEEEQQWPGTAINCGCTCLSIIPGVDDEEETPEEETPEEDNEEEAS